MKKVKLAALVTVGVIAGSLFTSSTAQAGSTCNNGSYSSNSGRGTCSWNGGVNRNLPSFSDPGSSSSNRNNGFSSSRNSGIGNDPYGFNKPYGDLSSFTPMGTQRTRPRR